MSDPSIESAGPRIAAPAGRGPRTVTLSTPYFSSHDVVLGDETVSSVGLIEKFSRGNWDGRPLNFELSSGAPNGLISMGFYAHEDFGAWSRIAEPWVILPFEITGSFAVTLVVRGYGSSVGCTVTASIGGCSRQFTLGLEEARVALIFEDVESTSEIHFSGLVMDHDENADDPRTMGLGLTSVELRHLDAAPGGVQGESRDLSLTGDGDECVWAVGVYYLEDWGAWSRDETVSLVLPFTVRGRVTIAFDIIGHGPSVGQPVTVRVGNSECRFDLKEGESPVTLSFAVEHPTALVTVANLIARPVPGQADQRTIAVGFRGLTIEQKRRISLMSRTSKPLNPSVTPEHGHVLAAPTETVMVDGIVYSVVLTAESADRDDWVEMMTAFCWVFRDDPLATLVIQAPDMSVTAFISKLMVELYRIGDIRCSVLLTLPAQRDAVQASLMGNASFVVVPDVDEANRTTMHAYLAAGTPAIASMTREEAQSYGGCVLAAPPLRRPVRVGGYRYRVYTELRSELNWNAFRAAFEESSSTAREIPHEYTRLRRVASEWGGRSL